MRNSQRDAARVAQENAWFHEVQAAMGSLAFHADEVDTFLLRNPINGLGRDSLSRPMDRAQCERMIVRAKQEYVDSNASGYSISEMFVSAVKANSRLYNLNKNNEQKYIIKEIAELLEKGDFTSASIARYAGARVSIDKLAPPPSIALNELCDKIARYENEIRSRIGDPGFRLSDVARHPGDILEEHKSKNDRKKVQNRLNSVQISPVRRVFQLFGLSSSRSILERNVQSDVSSARMLAKAAYNREKIIRRRKDILWMAPRFLYHYCGGWVFEAASILKSYIRNEPVNTPLMRHFAKTRDHARASVAREMNRSINNGSAANALKVSAVIEEMYVGRESDAAAQKMHLADRSERKTTSTRLGLEMDERSRDRSSFDRL